MDNNNANRVTIHEPQTANCIKEAVCVDSSRVYDSCCDKDCLEDLRCFFTEEGQEMVDQANTVRLRDVDVLQVFIDTEKVPFNKGFFTVDMTFFFKVELEICRVPASPSASVCGLCCFSKKVILYGSEGNVRIFSSEFCPGEDDMQLMSSKNLPKATVQVADPIGLDCRIVECCDDCDPCPCIPACIERCFHGRFCCGESVKKVFVSIGLFSIVQLSRNVQLLLPAYDFCIPENECVASASDNPCDLFRRIEFPVDEFFPPKANDCQDSCGSQHHSSKRCDCDCNKPRTY